VVFAAIFLSIVVAGSWIGIRDLRILRGWDAGELCMARRDFVGAENFYLSAEQIDPQVRKSHRHVAESQLKRYEYARAIPELQKAANGDRGDFEVHVMLGDALQAENRPAEALAEYRQAIVIAPRIADTYVRLGSCLVKLNRVNDAITQFRFAIGLDSRNVKAVANLGSLEMVVGRQEEGIGLLKRAVELAPMDLGAHNTLGTAYVQLTRFGDAAAEFRAEVAINPEFAPGYFNLGSALVQMGDNRLAEDAFRSYLRKCFSSKNKDDQIAVPKAFDELKRLQKLNKRQKPDG
jgi:tetratricopeptide (TPR) repeat protein